MQEVNSLCTDSRTLRAEYLIMGHSTQYIHLVVVVITGPPTHSVEGQTSDALWRLSSSVTLHGGPVGFRPVKATPCCFCAGTSFTRSWKLAE